MFVLQFLGIIPTFDRVTQSKGLVASTAAAIETGIMLREGQAEPKVRRKLKEPYDPKDPEDSEKWSGDESIRTKVEGHVVKNPPGKTLVLMDPSGKIKTLLDDLLRGRTGVLVPPMETFTLDEDISKALRINEGLSELGRLFKAATTPSRFRFFRRSKPEPFICIIDVRKRATEMEVVGVLDSTAMLKDCADKSLITIVCVEGSCDIAKLPLRQRKFVFVPSY